MLISFDKISYKLMYLDFILKPFLDIFVLFRFFIYDFDCLLFFIKEINFMYIRRKSTKRSYKVVLHILFLFFWIELSRQNFLLLFQLELILCNPK